MPIHILPFQDHFLPEAEGLIKSIQIFFLKMIGRNSDKISMPILLGSSHSRSRTYFVVTTDKIVCGLIMYQRDPYAHSAYNIKWLVVKEDEQNKGYGTKLVHEVFKKIREVGGKHLYLETSNERHNEHAKKFYEDLGFKKIGLLPDYYDPPIKFPRKLEDGIIYHKEL